MSFADISVSTLSAVKPCRFQQGTCEIGMSVSRTQAFPLTSDILMSLVAVSLLRGEKRLALAFLFGFTCLLRTGEIVSLTRRQLTFLGGGTQLHIALPDSEGAERLGRPGSVMLKQPHIVQFIAKAVEHMEPSELIYKGTHASLGRDLSRICLSFGLSHRNLTPYGLRKGGGDLALQRIPELRPSSKNGSLG